MNILVLTGYDTNKSFKEIGLLSAHNKYEYAMKNNYSFLCQRSYKGYDRPISWFKIKQIIDLLDNYDWIFWTDADSVITNFNIKIEDFIETTYERKETLFISPQATPVEIRLPELKEQNYIIAQDNYSPCMGEFIIRSCDWSKNFFSQIYKQIQFMDDPIWDNRGQDFLMFNNPEILEYCKFVPKKKINAFYKTSQGESLDWEHGDFLCHFPATEPERRLRYTKELLEKVIK